MAQPLAYTLIFLPASERPSADMTGMPVLVLHPDNGWHTADIRQLREAGGRYHTGIYRADGEELQPDKGYISWALLPDIRELQPPFCCSPGESLLPQPTDAAPLPLPVTQACINSILHLTPPVSVKMNVANA